MSTGEKIFTWEGISLPSYWGGNWGTATADAAFDQIRTTGASSVAIIPSFYMDNKSSNTMELKQYRSETIAQTKAAMLDVTSRGMNVMLKPHVESLDYTWRAEITPTDPNLWFANYKAMILQYAQLAQETGAPMLCIGTELKSLSGAQYRDKWVDLIAAVRGVYSGLVTYASTYDEVSQVSFWDQVDYIGVDAYIPLVVNNTSPTVQQLVNGWIQPSTNGFVNETYGGKSAIEFYRSLSEQYGKKIIFTEVGYRSLDGTALNPGLWADGGTVDHQEQKDAYDALFQVMTTHGGQWLDGAFLWSYHPFESPEAHGVQLTDFTTQGKPANTVITTYYSSPAHVTGLNLTGTSGADKLDGGYHNDILNGGAGNDTIWGGAGQDALTGGTGNDTLDGSSGSDTAVFSGPSASYSITTNSDGSFTVTDSRTGGDGADLLRNIQFAQFSDQTIGLGTVTPPPPPPPPTNSAPTDIAISNASVKENSAGGTFIGTLSAVDPNAGNTFTYSISSDPDAKFQIFGNQLQVRQGALLDYEMKTSHAVTIRVTDQGGLSYDETFTIRLVDIKNEKVRGGPKSEIIKSSSYIDGLAGGPGDDRIYSGSGNDVISGDAGNDRLYGGAGKDVLTGGTGRDIFVFNTALNRSTNVDKITDFSVRDDTIWLDNRYMAKLGAGTEARPGRLNSKYLAFDTAKDANDYLVYVRKTGVLLYDADGSGSKAAVAIAILKPGLKLTYADFQII